MNAHRWELLGVVWVDVVLDDDYDVDVDDYDVDVDDVDDTMNAHRWELLGVMWVDVVLAAHRHRQGDVSAVRINIHPPLSLYFDTRAGDTYFDT